MSSLDCPLCGNALVVDALTGEPRPCAECGTLAEVDESGKLLPNPEHQGNINRQKYFEIATVIIMIIVGFGYFAISNSSPGIGSTATEDLAAILRSENFDHSGTTVISQEFRQFDLQRDILTITIYLISPMEQDGTDTIILTTGLPAGKSFPPDDIAEKAIQESFDEMARLGELLVPSSTDGLSKAVNTTASLSKSETTFRRGAAQTNSGWKITYINYRSRDESGGEVPLLLFIYQRLDAASDPAQQEFNRALFAAVNAGGNFMEAFIHAMRDAEQEVADGN